MASWYSAILALRSAAGSAAALMPLAKMMVAGAVRAHDGDLGVGQANTMSAPKCLEHMPMYAPP